MPGDFHSIYAHGLLRIATAVPELRVADPAFNGARTLDLVRRAHESGAALVLFPELGLSGYSLDDLVQQDALLDACLRALAELRAGSRGLVPLIVVGAPLRFGAGLYNCAVVIHDGRLLGVVPKSYLPNYREFYEKRQFAAAREALVDHVNLLGETLPFGNDLLFVADGIEDFVLHVEICEDIWVPIPPSTWAALAGATVLANLSASNVTIGKADYRRTLCISQSARCVAAHAYTAAGFGESTTDLAWDGHAMICENGELLAESERFRREPQLLLADVDLQRLRQERMRLTSLRDQAADHADRLRTLRRIPFAFRAPDGVRGLQRRVARFPFVPSDPATLDRRCHEAFQIQVQGLARRLLATGLEHVVIGVSGGLDSTLALLVAVATMDLLGLPRDRVLAYTLPGFATSGRTLAQAQALMRTLGVHAGEIDIRPSCLQMLRDLDHPYARGEAVYDVTFENVQAGERTSHLFRLANLHQALVVGTGDLSELALGWCTYGVGDQMAHYNVNASLPKTLIQHLIRWLCSSGRVAQDTRHVLEAILETLISPELVPAQTGADGLPAQDSEAVIGPYELQDFNLYYLTRFGFRPSKVAFLALHAWGDRTRGDWPALIPAKRRHQYDLVTIGHWLTVFIERFLRNQFKRSAMPNGPKVGSGGSLSPRGDWRAPSDAAAEAWLDELARNLPSAAAGDDETID